MLDPRRPDDVEQVRSALAAKAEAQANKRRGLGHALALLAISVALFVVMQQSIAGQTGLWLAALVIVLAVHEGGHWLAMRAFGYRDLKVFFIPLLGAATSGSKRDATATQRAIVSLAGPLPGILFAFVASFFAPFESDLLAQLLSLALFINAFNLLPLLPLDGGRYLDTTLFARWPTMSQIVGHLSGLAIAGVGYLLEAWILLAFGVLTFFTASSSRALGRGAIELRKQVHAEDDREGPFPERLVSAGMELANMLVFAKANIPATPDRYANVLTKFWAKIGHAPPSTAATLVLLGVYAGAIAIVVLTLVQLGTI